MVGSVWAGRAVNLYTQAQHLKKLKGTHPCFVLCRRRTQDRTHRQKPFARRCGFDALRQRVQPRSIHQNHGPLQLQIDQALRVDRDAAKPA